MMHYQFITGAELAKNIQVDFTRDIVSSKCVIGIKGKFNIYDLKKYISRLYGSDHNFVALERASYFGKDSLVTQQIFDIFRNILMDEEKSDKKIEESMPVNFVELSKKLDQEQKQTRNKLKNICGYEISQENSDCSAIDTYLNYIDSKLNSGD